MPQQNGRIRHARRWWQRLGRWALVAAAVLLAAYATLPWWAPRDYLRQRIARQLSARLDAPVSIDDLRLSWGRGVQISRLTIGCPRGFDCNEEMLSIDRISADLSPVRFLLTGRTGSLEVEGVRLMAQTDSQGRWNVSPLRNLSGGSSSGAISIRQAAATINLPQQDRPIRLAIGELLIQPGTRGRLGQVTMSAAVEQQGSSAPIAFRLTAGDREPVVAIASLSFSNLDLEQLPLAELLSLPLRKCSGLCSGWAEVEVDRSGTVNRVGGNVMVSKLDMQPMEGPQLPVLDTAGLGVDASFDPITGQVSVHRFHVRLPGAGLTGSAELSAAAATGNWEAIRSIQLDGNVRPATLVALLTGKPSGQAGLELDGPVAVSLAGKYDGVRLDMDAAAQAEPAIIKQSGRVLKPAGRALTARLTGSLDRRSWRLSVEQGELVLGTNRLTGSGVLEDVRALVSLAQVEGRAAKTAALLDQLASMTWNGAWELGDWKSLEDLLAGTGFRAEISSAAPVTGRWLVSRSSAPRVHLILESPAQGELAVGELFRQPPGEAFRVDLAATVDPSACALRDLDGDVMIGDGRISLDRGVLTFADPSGDAADGSAVTLSGQFEAGNLASLAEAATALKGWGVAVSGAARGEFDLSAGAGKAGAHVSARMAQAEVQAGRYFHKPPGGRCDLDVTFAREEVRPPADRNRLTITASLPAGSLSAEAVISDGPQPPGRATVNLSVSDASQLLSESPALAEMLSGHQLTGQASLAANAEWQGRKAAGNLRLDATGAGFLSPGPTRRGKSVGAPLVVELAGGVEGRDDRLAARIDSASVALGASLLAFRGQADLTGLDAAGSSGGEGATFSGTFEGSIAADGPLCSVIPELAERVRTWGVTGAASVSGKVTVDRDSLSLDGRVDGGTLGLTGVPIDVGGSEAAREFGRLTFTKPPGLPAELSFRAGMSRRDGRLLIDDISGILAGVSLTGRMALHVGERPQRNIEVRGANLSVDVADARTLPLLVPRLRDFSPSGRLSLQADWTGGLRGGVVSKAQVDLSGIRGRFRDKEFGLDGTVTLEDIASDAGSGGAGWSIRRLATDGLELRAAGSHGWLVADATDLLDKPSGRFYILAEQIDDKELVDWLGGGSGQVGQPAPADPARREQLLDRAERIIDALRPHIADAALDGRVVIDRYRSYDPTVERYYLARYLKADLSARNGEVMVSAGAGLNGGVIDSKYHVNLTDPSPRVDIDNELRDMPASEDIQPQLAKYFPGNTVYGIFSRTEELTVPLRQVVARAMDPTLALYPLGHARTVTTDGLLEGRAVPYFVARIFPGLNLTRYRYNKMTGFADYQSDGLALNDMVFSGQTYDIYIEGTTDADNIGRYEIGLILLGTPQSAEWNHTYRQGRIPLLKVKARIEGGQMHDETVSFVYPNESLFAIFLKNNIFYRLWLAARK